MKKLAKHRLQIDLGKPLRAATLAAEVSRIIAATPVTDIHTHLYDPAFGELLLWGGLMDC